MLHNHWNESLSTGLMQVLNQIMVIVLRSRNEMTHQLWLYTPRKRTLGQYDYWHTVGQRIFEPSKGSLLLTDLRCITGSLPSSNKNPTSFKAWSQYWQWQYSEIIPQCYLSRCGLFSMSVHSSRIHVIQYNELGEEGHTWAHSGNSYLSGSWTGKQPVLRPLTRYKILPFGH